MIIEFSKFTPDQKHLPSVYIIGSGLAGLAAAHILEERGIDCIVFESGTGPGQRTWNISSDPMEMADYGIPESYSQLHIRREPGGGANVWGGWCTSLRSLTMSRTDLADYPSWPITRQDLLPYYQKAGQWLAMEGVDKAMHDEVLVDGSKGLCVKQFGFSPPIRYETALKQPIEQSSKITLVTGATVDSIIFNGNKAQSIVFVEQGRTRKIDIPGQLILAGGAVGNSRLIARSLDQLETGKALRPYVGNYYFEHPHCYAMGKVVFSPDLAATISDQKYWSTYFISITPSAEYLKSHGLTDFNFQLHKVEVDAASAEELAIAKNYEALYGIQPVFYLCTLGMEQMPRPNNTVLNIDTLERRQDGHLHLDMTQQHAVIDAARTWLYNLGVHAWNGADPAPSIQAVGHLHGTTRMGTSPENGVVDSDCRLFGAENLYLAGSSIFPTGGFTNPTMTIVALAMRLAEHLSGARK